MAKIKSYYDILVIRINEYQIKRAQPNLTPGEKAKYTKRIKSLRNQMAFYLEQNPEHEANQKTCNFSLT